LLTEYKIDGHQQADLLKQLATLGITGASLFSESDHLASDLVFDISNTHFDIGIFDWASTSSEGEPE
tara:strand:- start:135 stop:335 length:201 start_codon:yes stop_codon:yes gene_type:complete